MIRVCIQCGKEFEPRNWRQMLCSAECQHRHRVEWDHAHYLKQKEAQRKQKRRCIVCGREFTLPTRHQQRRTCSNACRYQRKLKYDAAYHRQRREKYTDRRACRARLLDCLERLEKTYGYAEDGTIRKAIMDWSERRN